jgi:NADPH-dependent curcumin reductase CurA
LTADGGDAAAQFTNSCQNQVKAMAPKTLKQIVLASRPAGHPTLDNFRLEEIAMPTVPSGGLMLRVLYLSLDPLRSDCTVQRPNSYNRS